MSIKRGTVVRVLPEKAGYGWRTGTKLGNQRTQGSPVVSTRATFVVVVDSPCEFEDILGEFVVLGCQQGWVGFPMDAVEVVC